MNRKIVLFIGLFLCVLVSFEEKAFALSFDVAPTYSMGSHQPDSLAAGDFNGDGNLDLAVWSIATLSMLPGNGDGTFQTEAGYSLGPGAPTSLIVGDFNRDGKPDLAAQATYGVSILLNTTPSEASVFSDVPSY